MLSERVHFRLCFQKNQDNRQDISYLKDKEHSKRCFIEVAKRIHNSTERLLIAKGNPISVLKDK